MNIKKKIAVWCALFALLVALVPPSSAKAEESECPSIPNAIIEQAETVVLVKTGDAFAIPNEYLLFVSEGELIIRNGDNRICTIRNGSYVYGEVWRVDSSNEWYLDCTHVGVGNNATETYDRTKASTVLYTNKNIYCQSGSDAIRTDEVWTVAGDYRESVSVSPVPTVVPSVGFDVITYNPTLVGSVVADSVYMRELPNVDSVAVGAFIKTWHVNVHGYCRDNDGVIWYLCSTVRDDIDYSGYIMAKYVKLESYGDIVIDFGDIDIGDIATIVDSAKESVLSILGLVGVVPMMIGAVFGFLPSWCLLMVGATVVVMCIVGIIKVFRG